MRSEQEISELINRRRRQVLVHSVIYYEFNENLITDSTWSKWALELEELQRQYPEIAEKCVYADAFRNFDHSTGADLPLHDGLARHKAMQLRNYDHKIKIGAVQPPPGCSFRIRPYKNGYLTGIERFA